VLLSEVAGGYSASDFSCTFQSAKNTSSLLSEARLPRFSLTKRILALLREEKLIFGFQFQYTSLHDSIWLYFSMTKKLRLCSLRIQAIQSHNSATLSYWPTVPQRAALSAGWLHC